jgi:uncharacterized protein YbgA (DUF1722 family)/uncharacterized protein YbbK (DUF523 family)
MIKSSIVDNLKNYVKFLTVCPEVEVGLGIPRDPIRLIQNQDKIKLVQPSTGLDLTQKMKEFADKYLESLPLIDGFILKNKSPSCGIKAVKIYKESKNYPPRRDGVGAFAREVYQRFYQLPVEDEGRLRNSLIREDFLTRIFTLANFRNILNNGKFNDLIQFQSRNKLLLMSHNQKYTVEMGRILSNRHENSLEAIKAEYGQLLLRTLFNPSNAPANVNILQHAFGYFSKELNSEEKQLFLETLQRYRLGQYPLLVLQKLIKSWILRFDIEYLKKQTFFQPYPENLMEITFI